MALRATARTRTRPAVTGHGLHVALPAAWEGRLYLRDQPVASRVRLPRALAHPHAYGHPGISPNPVLHLANFPLPPGRGDFGTGAVERMGPAGVFTALVEYDQDEAGRPLFADRGLPRPGLREFGPNQLQRRLAGQLGVQRFFTERDRAFCLYVVLGSRAHAPALVGELHRTLDGLRIGTRP